MDATATERICFQHIILAHHLHHNFLWILSHKIETEWYLWRCPPIACLCWVTCFNYTQLCVRKCNYVTMVTQNTRQRAVSVSEHPDVMV